MFDIGFSEVLLLLVIGLIVLGPQRLPVAIRTVMGWISTIRNTAHRVQAELAQELKLQELQDSIRKVEQMGVGQISPELAQTVKELKASAEQVQAQIQNELNQKIDLDQKSASSNNSNADLAVEDHHTTTPPNSGEISSNSASPSSFTALENLEEQEQKSKEDAINSTSLEINPSYFPEDELANSTPRNHKLG